VKAVEVNLCRVLIPGIDYVHCKIENDMLLVEHHSGESEMSNEEFMRRVWPEDQLCPATGGHLFDAWTVGTGYMHEDVE
jgi:hypothetical protein